MSREAWTVFYAMRAKIERTDPLIAAVIEWRKLHPSPEDAPHIVNLSDDDLRLMVAVDQYLDTK